MPLMTPTDEYEVEIETRPLPGEIREPFVVFTFHGVNPQGRPFKISKAYVVEAGISSPEQDAALEDFENLIRNYNPTGV